MTTPTTPTPASAPPSSPEGFITKLEKCRLFSAEQFAQIRSWISSGQAPSRKALLQKLFEQRWITQWQAEELQAGRYEFYVGQYRLLDRLGAGGRGTVFKAQHPSMNRLVALKVMAKELMSKPEAVARFRREVESAAVLNHPNIIAAHDAAQDGEVHFLVMEYIPGHDLNYWLQKYGPLPIAWACECMRQAALGLQHAHERNLVHRDIKPGNLLVSAKGIDLPPQLKILDLGCALFIPDNGGDPNRLTQAWQTFGTPDYMAPEQAESARNADIRSDIFSLGCTLFKLLTGDVPYSGATPLQKLLARASHDAPRIRTRRPEIPEGLDAVIAKMLARPAKERYQTPDALAAALAPYSLTITGSALSDAVASESPSQSSIGTAFEKPGPADPNQPHVLDLDPQPVASASPAPAHAPGVASAEAKSVGPLPAVTKAAAAPSADRKQRITAAVVRGLGFGAFVGIVVGGIAGAPLALAFRALVPGDSWQIAFSVCLSCGLSLGAAYHAAVAAALAASEE